MLNLWTDCEIEELTQKNPITNFDCGDGDINDFFNNEAILFRQQLLGQTHFFRQKATGKVVCAFSLCADSVKTFLLTSGRRNRVRQFIPHDKSLQSFPAFLIGRFGVSTEFGGAGIGTQLMEYIKEYSLHKFPNFGRFLLVDAYNKPEVLTFYQKNDFLFLFTDENQERENLKKIKNSDEPLHTRQMFYDLRRS